jgi:hypothetical protein
MRSSDLALIICFCVVLSIHYTENCSKRKVELNLFCSAYLYCTQNSVYDKLYKARSAVRVAMGYGLDGKGSIPDEGKIFPFSTASTPALGPTQPPTQWVTGTLSPALRRLWRGADHLPPSSA